MFKGFRDFVLRGNVIDLAVAVVIGAAFTALVNAIVANLIDPLVRVVLGGEGDIGGTIQISGETIDVAAIISALITFLVTALVVFYVFVAPMNRVRALAAKRSGQPDEDVPEPEDIVLLREIRDLLRRENPAASSNPQGQDD